MGNNEEVRRCERCLVILEDDERGLKCPRCRLKPNDVDGVGELAASSPAWDIRYRALAEGETILETDEVQLDGGGWGPVQYSAGQPAPSPLYTSHRKYRRLISSEQLQEGREP